MPVIVSLEAIFEKVCEKETQIKLSGVLLRDFFLMNSILWQDLVRVQFFN